MNLEKIKNLNIIQISKLIVSIYKCKQDEYIKLCNEYKITPESILYILYENALYRKLNIDKIKTMFYDIYNENAELYINIIKLLINSISTEDFVNSINEMQINENTIYEETAKHTKEVLTNCLNYCIQSAEIDKMEKICKLIDMCEIFEQAN